MKQSVILFFLVLLICSCASNKITYSTSTSAQDGSGDKILGSSTFPGGQPTSGDPFEITEVSTDNTYGYKESNPIKVGGSTQNGALNERRFLNALTGPNGEAIQYVRIGSCCPFETKNSLMGQGLLDKYKITWTGQTEEVFLFINMYDKDKLKIPVGLSSKK